MGIVVDSSVLIGLERRGRDAESLRELAEEAPAVAAVTVSELLFGLHRAQTDTQKSRRKQFIEGVTGRLMVLLFDLRVAEIHAIVLAGLVTSGQRIGVHDVMIAATALTHGHAVLTDNIREFTRVPGLVVRSPNW